MNILGISCWYHDAAACLLQDGRIAAAAQEERFTRVKHDASFPRHAINWCLEHAGLTTGDLDVVAFYDKPFLKFERLLETYLTCAPRGLASFIRAMPIWLKRSLWIPDILRKELDYEGPLIFPEHHESHAASAFYPSPFEHAAIITLDGVGEWTTTSWGTGRGAELDLLSEIHFPHSLGLFYSAVTYFCGFRVNSGEYKLMGLAPYGEPQYVQQMLDELIDLKSDGSFRLNMRYFSYPWRLTMTHGPFAQLFGGPPRKPEGALTRRTMNLARSAQMVIEEAVFRLARHVQRTTTEKHLCLAGGVALNCVANGTLHRSGLFEDIWIQPAAGDAGGALGAALMAWHGYAKAVRTPTAPDAMRGALLGVEFGAEQIRTVLETHGLDYEESEPAALVRQTAELLVQQRVVGWFQGRMEYGPRALGNRSILADPRSGEMQFRVNLKIKYRESFRPFAPAVRIEDVSTWFDHAAASPYMLMTAPVLDAITEGEHRRRLKDIESPIPAVTHVDGSARIQTVDAAVNPLFHQLLTAFKARTGCPVLVNTSFNVRGEPIVCTPQDAVTCFLRTHMDVLVIGPFVVWKTAAHAKPLEPQEAQRLYGLD
ncbi:MAG: carbamoyltransferase [Bacteroidota bacterium]|nr:carbamoyltransferase [Bacteroidota bacterium]MDE2835663.1 carbamoyltransferase [Bacteroidota bacterium]MDE2955396.1 carbamoyltransferase [Bacteroidota bacterium]